MDKLNVFMPCYNAEPYLKDAVESILNQEYRDFKLIAIDDGSKDNSLQILDKFAEGDNRVRIYQNEKNQGVAYTRNRGIELCDSEFIAFMDADDIAPKKRLKIQMSFLDKNPDVDGVFGNYQKITENGDMGEQVIVPERKNAEIGAALFFRNVLANGTAIIRKSIVEKNGIYYRDFCYGKEDYRFWADFYLAGAKMEILPDVLQYYRIVSTGLSQSNAKEKMQEINQVLDEIHELLLEQFPFFLDEKHKKLYLELTRGEGLPRTAKKKFYDRIRAYKLIKLLKSQVSGLEMEEVFAGECEIFVRQFKIKGVL